MSSSGNLQAAGQNCLKKADAWLLAPSDKVKLKQALQTTKETNEEFKKDEKLDKAVLADLELLQGALNMAQMQVNDGKDPTKPSELSEFPPTNAVTVASEQLRTDLGNLANAQHTP